MGKKFMMVGSPVGDMKEMRKRAQERYHEAYHFKKGVRVASPDRDPYSYKEMSQPEKADDHFYGIRNPQEIAMCTGQKHTFAGARTAAAGHSIYGNRAPKQKGHMLGKR